MVTPTLVFIDLKTLITSNKMKLISQVSFFAFYLLIGFIACTPSSVNNGNNTGGGTNTGTYTVTVNKGYGSATYSVGDTVHIWSRECSNSETFTQWTGDTLAFSGKNEWHTWFIMPAQNITVTASFQPVNYNMTYEKIIGKNILKNVYYNLSPTNKGIVYLFHGAGGSASYWVDNYEPVALIKDLIINGFGVIVTEAEEVSLQTGGSTPRWNTTTLDSNVNVDFANLIAITNTFINRGLTNNNIPKYSIGQSNGGSASIAVSSFFGFKAGVAYCAAGGAAGNAISGTNTPILFCLEQLDNNSLMGQAGDANAINNSSTLKGRGICSAYFMNIPSPLYPERFARNTLISTSLSQSIFNEIKSNGLLDNSNHFIGYYSNLVSAVKAHPQSFPTIAGLSGSVQNILYEQLNCVTTAHQFYSDHNLATIRFLNNPCSVH